VDVQGVESCCKAAQASPLLAKHMGTVFINVPIPELRVRLTGRGESEAEIAHRMETAANELKEIGKFDFVVESRNREDDFAALLAIWRQVQARAEGAA
jgi:guanylate kinase